MGRKKKKFKPLIFCYYCDREFENEKVLIQHQRAKHFKCSVCHKRLGSAHGMMVHVFQVHKRQIEAVPHAKQGRDSFDINIFGMMNVPKDVIDDKMAERGEPPKKKQKLNDGSANPNGQPQLNHADLVNPFLGINPVLMQPHMGPTGPMMIPTPTARPQPGIIPPQPMVPRMVPPTQPMPVRMAGPPPMVPAPAPMGFPFPGPPNPFQFPMRPMMNQPPMGPGMPSPFNRPPMPGYPGMPPQPAYPQPGPFPPNPQQPRPPSPVQAAPGNFQGQVPKAAPTTTTTQAEESKTEKPKKKSQLIFDRIDISMEEERFMDPKYFYQPNVQGQSLSG